MRFQSKDLDHLQLKNNSVAQAPFNWAQFNWRDEWKVSIAYTNDSTEKWINKYCGDQKVYFDCEFNGMKLGLVQLGVSGNILIVDMLPFGSIEPIQKLFWDPRITKIGFATHTDMRVLRQASIGYSWTSLTQQRKTDSFKKKEQAKILTNWSKVSIIDLQPELQRSIAGSSNLNALQRTYLPSNNPCSSEYGKKLRNPTQLCLDKSHPSPPYKRLFKLTEYASLAFPTQPNLVGELNKLKKESQQSHKWADSDAIFDKSELRYAASDVVLLYYLEEFLITEKQKQMQMQTQMQMQKQKQKPLGLVQVALHFVRNI